MDIANTSSTPMDICPGTSKTAMPDISGVVTIPQDIDVVMITGNNITSNPAMTACCSPNKVQLLDGCYLWCKIPGGDYYTNTGKTGAPKLVTKDDIFRNISSCLELNGYSSSKDGSGGGGRSIQAHIVSASLAAPGYSGRGSVSLVGLGVWALVVSAFGGVLMG